MEKSEQRPVPGVVGLSYRASAARLLRDSRLPSGQKGHELVQVEGGRVCRVPAAQVGCNLRDGAE